MGMIKWRKMKKVESFFQFKYFIMTGLGVISFSYFVYVLFGQTIPNIILTFFKDVGEMIIIGAVFAFAFAWLLKSSPQKKPKKYSVIAFDVFGTESNIQGIRTEFKIHDVAWSYMRQYKKSYPLYNFALVSDNLKSEKKTIIRYI
jgi:hypothetical protein